MTKQVTCRKIANLDFGTKGKVPGIQVLIAGLVALVMSFSLSGCGTQAMQNFAAPPPPQNLEEYCQRNPQLLTTIRENMFVELSKHKILNSATRQVSVEAHQNELNIILYVNGKSGWMSGVVSGLVHKGVRALYNQEEGYTGLVQSLEEETGFSPIKVLYQKISTEDGAIMYSEVWDANGQIQ